MTERARVLHVITRLEGGGAQRNTLYTVSHLNRDEFEVGLAWGVGDELDTQAQEISDLWRCPVVDLVRPAGPSGRSAPSWSTHTRQKLEFSVDWPPGWKEYR
jgi:hypothetical protein